MPRKPRYATAALFHDFPATLIAEVLCCTRQTAYHFKSGIRRPGATAMRLWTLYRDGRILGDEWLGWHARDGALFDPQGQRTSIAMLRAYGFVWQLARELAHGSPHAMEALDSYARLAYEAGSRSTRARKRSALERQRRTHMELCYAEVAELDRAARSADRGASGATAPCGSARKTGV